MTKIEDSFFVDQLPSTWKICEDVQDNSGSVVDGEHIIARAAGPFFVVDGESGNNRFYSKGLWESAISNNMDRISNREMLGTIGHDHSIDDDALREGKISHIVSKLWIDEATKVGMGEVLILNTPAGKSLNTLLRAGVRLKISSRATGSFNGKSPTGSQLIDEKSYKLDGFDFVQTPGVATAIPRIIESLENQLESITGTIDPEVDTTKEERGNTPQIMEVIMDEKLIQSLTEDKVRLDDSLQVALSENESLKAVNKSTSELNENLRTEKSRIEQEVESLEKSHREMEENLSSIQESLDSFEKLGTAESLAEAVEKLTKYETSESKLGTAEEVEEALNRAESMIDQFAELGTSAELEEALDRTSKYVDLGTVEELATKVDEHSKYSELATLDELDECIKVLDTYVELGTPSQIDSIFESFTRHLDEDKERKADSAAKELAEEYSVSLTTVKKLLAKNSESDAKELLEELKVNTRSTQVNRYQKPVSESADKLHEAIVELPTTTQGSRASRLINKRSR